ncbi:MAG TPA: haloacid dehalogenase [Ignisphaera aggregans]|uniref:Haloacid dehalogenase n=1 Tax=Ignisphaera aggregans TaxID=334771 RepID=A0A832Z2W2_9CREN|nr:haloacid dehalogenase [Ignisphaera aggregans]
MSRAEINLERLFEAVKKSVEEIERILQVKDSVREEIIRISRDIIRLSGDVITYVHTGDLEKARESLKRAEDLVRNVMQLVESHPELKYSGIINNALSEFIEATLLLRLVSSGDIPTFSDLGFHYIPYLNGLCDFVGELKRMAIDAMRRDDYSYAQKLLQLMEWIYNEVRKLDYPEALVPGLRHKVDVMRKVIEDLRTFLLDLEKRWTLIRMLEKHTVS